MTKILFLGSGSAFTVGEDNFQSNMFIIGENGNKLLIDCGSDIRFSLHVAGFSYLDITDIYISHLHADHVGGLEYVGFSSKFDSRCHKPNLYLSKEIASELWGNTLSGGMQYLEGDIADLETFFSIYKIKLNSYFDWQGIKFELVRMKHIDTGYFLMPSYGLFFEVDGIKVFVTTDTQFCPDLIGNKYEEANIIFQDCATNHCAVHAHYQELVNLPNSIKNKMWLYGYHPGQLPKAINDGFLGFVKRGQVFDFSSLARKAEDRG